MRPSFSELTPVMFYIELTHLGLEASIYNSFNKYQLINLYKRK